MSLIHSTIQAVIYGLLEGGLIAISAIGFSLVFSLVGIINLAHGDYMAMGAYLVLFVGAVLPLSFVPSVLLAVPIAGIIGVVIARIFYKPIRDEGFLPVLLTALGVAFLLRSIVRYRFGKSPIAYDLPLMKSYQIMGFFIPPLQGGAAVASMVVVALLFAALRYTRWGKALRALADNREMAQAFGIPTERYISIAWFISVSFAALSGIMFGITRDVTPALGWDFILLIFASTVLGGVGHLTGAVLGAFIIGIVINLGTIYTPQYELAAGYVLMIFILYYRPQGILGGDYDEL